MTGLAGADPDDLDNLAIAFQGFSRRLHDSCSSISTGVHTNPWRGQRADEFRHQWDRQFWPAISGIIGALDNVQKLLHDNANQQRQASGGLAKNYNQGNFFSQLFKEAEQGVGSADHLLRHVIASKEFSEFLGAVQVVATVASLAGFPEVAVAVALIVLVGHAAQMANTGKWNVAELAADAVGVAVPGVTKLAKFAKAADQAERATKAVTGAEDLNLVKSAGDPEVMTNMIKTIVNSPRTAVVVTSRVVQSGIDTWHTTDQVGRDLRQGDFVNAAKDSLGYGKIILDAAHVDSNIVDVIQDGVSAGQQVVSHPDGSPVTWVKGTLCDIGEPDQ